MSLTARLEGQVVIASMDLQRQAPYACRWCNEQLLIRQGTVVIAHFAHYPTKSGEKRTRCPLNKPESTQHLQMKLALYQRLPDAELEYRVDQNIFDVHAGEHVYECQYSDITEKDYDKRRFCAERNGLQLHWVLGVGEWVNLNLRGHLYGPSWKSIFNPTVMVANPTWFERRLAGIGCYKKIRPLYYYNVKERQFFVRLFTHPERGFDGTQRSRHGGWEFRQRELQPPRQRFAMNPSTRKFELVQVGTFGERTTRVLETVQEFATVVTP
jgi:hypothetical protein